ncbi:TrmB family transcriptional regulator sugar-binding domain-containing protein [Halorarum halophilum]|uniref:TrmB family transcriptional regulator sugar-binding domain-containing protein n=1 Tax=Halorarum halophilum TaxID=2743090 RepID=UPI002AA2AADE|nr:TrmB family transcriptional regulator sugar-binding domain-containing protein [Halobaculum halophilum]
MEALDSLESVHRTEEQRGVWTVTGRDTVTGRVLDFIEAAEEEVVYMTVGDLLTHEIVEQLRAASERGVSIRIASMSRTAEDDIREEVPDAEVFESLWNWSDTPTGRLLMVDEDRTLVSVLVQGSGDRPSEARDETAI